MCSSVRVNSQFKLSVLLHYPSVHEDNVFASAGMAVQHLEMWAALNSCKCEGEEGSLQKAVRNERSVVTWFAKGCHCFGFDSEDRSHAGVHSPGWEEPCTAAQLSTGLPQVSVQQSFNKVPSDYQFTAEMNKMFLHSRYLVKNSASLFNASDYEVAPPEYHRKAV